MSAPAVEYTARNDALLRGVFAVTPRHPPQRTAQPHQRQVTTQRQVRVSRTEAAPCSMVCRPALRGTWEIWYFPVKWQPNMKLYAHYTQGCV
jgi:hypothetical protein